MSEPGDRVGELRLPPELSGPLVEEAIRASPLETCGLIVGRRESDEVSVSRTVSCENTAPPEMRETRFSIDPHRLIEEERWLRDSPEEVVGFYHSHPSSEPVPSWVDCTYMALWPDAVWVIVGLEDEEDGSQIRAWNLDGGEGESPREIRILESVDESRGHAGSSREERSS